MQVKARFRGLTRLRLQAFVPTVADGAIVLGYDSLRCNACMRKLW